MVLHFLGDTFGLECKKPVICDTNLQGVKEESLQAKFLEYSSETNGCMEVLTSGLIEVAAFPPSFVSPKILQLCIDHYDVKSKSILSKDGTIVLSILRETVASVLHLTTNTFVVFSPTQVVAEYWATPSIFQNT